MNFNLKDVKSESTESNMSLVEATLEMKIEWQCPECEMYSYDVIRFNELGTSRQKVCKYCEEEYILRIPTDVDY